MRLALFIAASGSLIAQSFEKDVQPIFKQYCYSCHAHGVRMGTLDVQTHEGIMRGGNQGKVIVPGKSEESRLYLSLVGKVTPPMPMDGRKLAAGEIEVIKRWIDNGAKADPGGSKPVSGTAIAEIKPRVPVKPAIYSLAWNSRQLAAGGYRNVQLFDAGGKQNGVLEGHTEAVRAVAITKSGELLAAAGGLPAQKGEVKVWDLASRRVIASIAGHSDCIYAAAFSPDGNVLATASYDKMIYLWDARSGKQLRPLKDHIDAVYALAFSPDGSRLISAGADRTVKVWDAATGERLYTFSESTDIVNALAISPDGKQVAAAGNDKTIRIWNLGERGGELANSLIAHEDAILRLAWSPDGSTLVSAAADRTIKVFRASDLTERRVIANQPEWVTGLSFDPEGRRFAAGLLDGSLVFFDVREPAPPARAAN